MTYKLGQYVLHMLFTDSNAVVVVPAKIIQVRPRLRIELDREWAYTAYKSMLIRGEDLIPYESSVVDLTLATGLALNIDTEQFKTLDGARRKAVDLMPIARALSSTVETFRVFRNKLVEEIDLQKRRTVLAALFGPEGLVKKDGRRR